MTSVPADAPLAHAMVALCANFAQSLSGSKRLHVNSFLRANEDRKQVGSQSNMSDRGQQGKWKTSPG